MFDQAFNVPPGIELPADVSEEPRIRGCLSLFKERRQAFNERSPVSERAFEFGLGRLGVRSEGLFDGLPACEDLREVTRGQGAVFGPRSTEPGQQRTGPAFGIEKQLAGLVEFGGRGVGVGAERQVRVIGRDALSVRAVDLGSGESESWRQAEGVEWVAHGRR